MSLKNLFVKIRDGYVIKQVHCAKLPDFTCSPIRRYQVVFSGRVQKVGFRLEVCELAKRLNLTGFCRNLENGDVLAELQGPENKIVYLIAFMESLVRIKVTNRTIKILEVNTGETGFTAS
ncbi:MAG: acylphosphatase [Oscillospiraceae bacterium]|nr:acylphosphatase [Oscillospiraceae bacterium]